jgi:cyclopropane fatty-acyl-phospholipid synthase-like methyltransferase
MDGHPEEVHSWYTDRSSEGLLAVSGLRLSGDALEWMRACQLRGVERLVGDMPVTWCDVTAGAIRQAVARTAEFYDQWTDRFVAGFGTTFQAGFLKPDDSAREDAAISSCLLAARAGVRDGDRVLDAGCGVGGPAIAIAEAHPGCTIDGVTVSTASGARPAPVSGLGLEPRVSISQADYHDLPFADDSFDVALFLESCGYSPDRRALFAEAARVVSRAGRST